MTVGKLNELERAILEWAATNLFDVESDIGDHNIIRFSTVDDWNQKEGEEIIDLTDLAKTIAMKFQKEFLS